MSCLAAPCRDRADTSASTAHRVERVDLDRVEPSPLLTAPGAAGGTHPVPQPGPVRATGTLANPRPRAPDGHAPRSAAPAGHRALAPGARQRSIMRGCFVLYCSRDCRRAGRWLASANRRGYPPPKPLSAKRIPANIRSLCRSYTGEAVRSLAAIMRNADAPPRARLRAIDILLDRGWGKPSQPPQPKGRGQGHQGDH